jgi:hypothetical protein
MEILTHEQVSTFISKNTEMDQLGREQLGLEGDNKGAMSFVDMLYHPQL